MSSGTDRHLDITFGLQAVGSSSLVSVVFREVFSYLYMSFLLVNVFSLTSFCTFFYHSFTYLWVVSVGREELKW